MTEQQFTNAWREVSKHYNSIGSVLDVLALTALYDAYDAISETPLYRQMVKMRLNESIKIADSYQRAVKQAYGEKYDLWVNYNMALQNQLESRVFVLYNSIHRFFSKRKVKHLTECALAMKALVLASNAREFHDDFFDGIEKGTHIRKFRQLYSYAKLDGICAKMQDVCKSILPFKNSDVTQFNTDQDISLALTSINNYLNDEDNLNIAAKSACQMDMEQYGEALRELEEKEMAKEAHERAEKAAADKVSAEIKKEAQSAKNDAIAIRLSEKFKVTRVWKI